jgi:hypothetical protein
VGQVHIPAAELRELAEPQPAPGRDQDRRSVPLGHLVHDHGQLGQAGRLRRAGSPGGAGASDLARVHCDRVIRDGGVQDRPEQPVGVRLAGRAAGEAG